MSIFSSRVSEILVVLEQFGKTNEKNVIAVAQSIFESINHGGKLLICGNGGSAADAQHFAAEMVSSFAYKRDRRSLPAIALTTDSSIITAISNDFGYEEVFARQIEGLGDPGDCILLISTSGESRNVLCAAKRAREKGITVLSLTKRGSTLQSESKCSVAIDSENTQHIQECHVIAYHIIAEIVEENILGSEKYA
jgi:D-sedoheptulose 7-phosphate isomerase